MKSWLRVEKGFTLPEMITGLFIMGILVAFTIPLFSELKSQQMSDQARGEAFSLLQGKIEKLREQASPSSLSGEDQVKSRNQPSLTYHLKWNSKQQTSTLKEVKVEISWSTPSGKMQSYHLVTNIFTPSTNMKMGLLTLN